METVTKNPKRGRPKSRPIMQEKLPRSNELKELANKEPKGDPFKEPQKEPQKEQKQSNVLWIAGGMICAAGVLYLATRPTVTPVAPTATPVTPVITPPPTEPPIKKRKF